MRASSKYTRPSRRSALRSSIVRSILKEFGIHLISDNNHALCGLVVASIVIDDFRKAPMLHQTTRKPVDKSLCQHCQKLTNERGRSCSGRWVSNNKDRLTSSVGRNFLVLHKG